MNTHGGRHVVTALCSHHATRACGPFALIQVEDYALRGHNNIYFMCVEFIDGRFVGYAPVVDEGEAYIGLATSADGVSFSKFARVAASEPVRKSTSLLGFRETIVHRVDGVRA